VPTPAPGVPQPAPSTASTPLATIAPSAGSVAFQTASDRYAHTSIDAQLNPRKSYVARVRSDPPGMQVSISTEHLTDVIVTTPWEGQIDINDRVSLARFGMTSFSYLLASKEPIGTPGAITAEIVETGTVDVQLPSDKTVTASTTQSAPVTSAASSSTASAATNSPSVNSSSSGSNSGCGSRGGPGYRKANGQCASWADARAGRH
jgi:hypothetical protein